MATHTAGGNAAFHNFHNDYAHIADPNERRRLALAEIDKAPFGWYHVRAIVVAGVGFFTDAYDIFAINLTTQMFGLVYWHTSNKGAIPTNSDTAIKVATSGGTVLGQLGFGFLADIVGRKKNVRLGIDGHHHRDSRSGTLRSFTGNVLRRRHHLLACDYGYRNWRRLPSLVYHHL